MTATIDPTLLPPLTTGEILWSEHTWGFWAFMVFFVGLFMGSFFNVAIYRTPLGLSVNTPRWSFCFRCGTNIRWYDNLPIISYLLLRGRCRSCGAPFSARYAGIELLTGLLWLAIFVVNNPTWELPFQWATLWHLAFVSMLLIGTFTDLDHWIIPDGITIGGTIAALVAAVATGLLDDFPLLARSGPLPVLRTEWGGDGLDMAMGFIDGPGSIGVGAEAMRWWDPAVNAVIGGALGVGLLLGIAWMGRVVFRKEAMGLGDVKLFAMVGATLGPKGCLLALGLATIFGAAAGVAGIVAGRLGKPAGTLLQEGQMLVEAVGSGDGVPDRPPTVADRLARLAETIPRSRPVHHLPFGPWIALGATLVILLQGRLLQ